MNEADEKDQTKNQEKSQSPWYSTIKGMAVMSVMSGYIFGPLIIMGGMGWWLTKMYDNKLFVLAGVVIAFITTLLLVLKNAKTILKRFK